MKEEKEDRKIMKERKIGREWKKERLGKKKGTMIGKKERKFAGGGEDIIKECVVLKKERKNERV